MVFKPKKYKLSCPEVFLGNTALVYVDTAKYLGYVLRSDFSDDNEMMNQVRLLYARANTILRQFHNCSINVKVHLFRSYCLNFYCSSLWTHFKKQTFNKLRVAFNNVHRKLLNYSRSDSASTMFVTNNLVNFEALLRKSVHSFTCRLYSCNNCLIQTFIKTCNITNSFIWSRWNSMLYN